MVTVGTLPGRDDSKKSVPPVAGSPTVRAGLRPHILFLAAVTAFVPALAAADSRPLFGARSDPGTLAVQQKVEQLYQNGEFERALFIYENELAPVGDKYAQYMVGFMHLTGTGTAEDPVAASAWYRLAAERSYPEFVAVRDQLLEAFDESDLLRSDYEYRDLRRKYSDLVILERLIREDLKLLEPLTGSRLSGSTRAVTIIEPRSGLVVSGEQLRERARARIEQRLRQIDALIDGVDIETDPDRLDPALLREQVKAAVMRIDDRGGDPGR
jgi:hypothetical protein